MFSNVINTYWFHAAGLLIKQHLRLNTETYSYIHTNIEEICQLQLWPSLIKYTHTYEFILILNEAPTEGLYTFTCAHFLPSKALTSCYWMNRCDTLTVVTRKSMLVTVASILPASEKNYLLPLNCVIDWLNCGRATHICKFLWYVTCTYIFFIYTYILTSACYIMTIAIFFIEPWKVMFCNAWSVLM